MKDDQTVDCKSATFLIEKQQTENITPKERLALELHLKTCDLCNIFKKQSVIINKLVKKLFHLERSEAKLDEVFKEQIQKQLDEKWGNASANK